PFTNRGSVHPEEWPVRVACGLTPRDVAIPNAAPGTQRAPGLSLSRRRESGVEDGLRLAGCRYWRRAGRTRSAGCARSVTGQRRINCLPEYFGGLRAGDHFAADVE